MRFRATAVSLLVLCLGLAAPAVGQTIYDNGPTNGNTNAWNINFGSVVSDTFTISNNGSTITGAQFGMWLYPGDILTSAELSITSGENGGTSYFDQTVSFTQSACTANQHGFNVCVESSIFSGPTLNDGTYWINLQNASDPNDLPIYWDENSGPSLASKNNVGSIPSESFTMLSGCASGGAPPCGGTTTTTTSVPEPSSIMLFGSAAVGLAGLLRRRFF